MDIQLRPYQSELVPKLRDGLRGRRCVMLQSPTGSGKTVIFCYIVTKAVKKNKRAMILVHRKELVNQCSDALDSLSVEHGLIQAGKSMSYDPIQVASVQTLARRLGKVPAPDLIIVDEGHHAAAGSWRKILEYYPNAKILMVTATPCRLDGKGLGVDAGGFAELLINGPSVKQLIADGYLSDFKVFAPSLVDVSKMRTKFGDYHKQDLDKAMTKKIYGDAVEHYQRICPGVPGVAFCVSVEAARDLSDQFNASGIPSLAIDGTLDNRARANCIESLANGRIKILTSCDIIAEGTDIPVITAIIMLRPTQSLGLYLQQAGRGLRPHDDKEYTIILDHVGNVHRHGFPDLEREWTLESTTKKKKKKGESDALGMKQCSKCFLMVENYVQICPNCGTGFISQEREVEVVDVDLEEMKREKIQKKLKLKKEQAGAESLEALELIAHERGYKKSWAKHVWNSRQSKIKKGSQW